MRIGITGANGFIGQALSPFLLKKGLFPVAITRCKFSQLDIPNRIVSILTDEAALTSALQGCNVLVHLASRAHVSTELTDKEWIDYRKANVDSVAVTARAAAAAGVKRIVYMSSIKVNGEHTLGQPFTANSPPQPEDAYGISKYEAEQAFKKATQKLRLELVIIRSPLVYGEGVKGNLASLKYVISRGVPLPFASIRNKRDLISLPNLCDLIATCVAHPRASDQVFLAADGVPRSVPEIIQLLTFDESRNPRLFPCPKSLLWLAGRLMGKQAQIERLVGDLEVDISHTCERLNWQPSTHHRQASFQKA